MSDATSRVSHDNEAMETPEKQGGEAPPPKRIVPGDPAAGGVAEDEDIDETMAGGLDYPDDHATDGTN
jgi:hypothetical protein